MKKSTKIVTTVGIVLVSILLTIWVGEMILRRKIEKELTDTHIGNFRLTCEQVRASVFRRSLILNGITVKSTNRNDTARLPIQYIDARIRQISVSGISLLKLINKEVDIRELTIDSPNARLVTHQVPADATDTSGAEKKELPPIEIGELHLLDGSFDWQQIAPADTRQCHIAGVTADLPEFSFDPQQQITLGEKSTAGIDSIRYLFQNQAYILALDSIQWNGMEQLLSVFGLALHPRYSKWEFPRKSARKSDYMQLDGRDLTVSGLHIEQLWKEKRLEADSIHLASGHLTSSKDRNAVVPVRVKPMLHTTIQQLGILVDVRKVKVDDFSAIYEETTQGRNTPGQIMFEHIDATITGFTNIVRHADQYIRLHASARLMGTGRMSVEIFLPVDPANDRFDVQATLQSTSLRSLNRMILPLTNVKIKSGKLNRMDFRLTGNSTSATASMTMLYSDLKLHLLKMKNGKWKERNRLSKLANWALIKDENSERRGVRSAQTIVLRDPHRSVFNYLWKSISAGALETIGTDAAKTTRKKK